MAFVAIAATISCAATETITPARCSTPGTYSDIELTKFTCSAMHISYKVCTSVGISRQETAEVPLRPIHRIRLSKASAPRHPFTMFFKESRAEIEYFLVESTKEKGDFFPLREAKNNIIQTWVVPKGASLPKAMIKKNASAYFLLIDAAKIRTLYHYKRLPRPLKWSAIGSCKADTEDPSPLVESVTKDIPFTINGSNSVPFELFNVLAPGNLTISVEWTGESNTLQAVLTGRRRPSLADPASPYDESTGTSPLNLSYVVTDADLARGVGWRLALYDMSGNGSAQGIMHITYPYDAGLDSDFQKEKVRLRSGDHWPSAYLHSQFVDALQASSLDRKHGIISLARPLTCKNRWHIEQQKIRMTSPLPRFRSYGSVNKESELSSSELSGVFQHFTPLEPEDKIDPHILLRNYARYSIKQIDIEMPKNYVLDSSGKIRVSVLFSDDVDYVRVKQIASASPCTLELKGDHYYVGTCTADELVALAENDEVEWIGPGPAPHLITNENTRPFMNVDAVQNAQTNVAGDLVLVGGMPNYTGLTGNGVNIAICEYGLDGTHDDLAANIVLDDPSTSAAHGTHVAGIAAGNGIRSSQNDINGNPNNGTPFQFRGMAPEAGLIDAPDSCVLDGMSRYIGYNSMDLSTHSHILGTVGDYSAGERTVDQAIHGGATFNGSIIPRKPSIGTSANNGRDNPQYGDLRGYYSILNQAKNALILGNWFRSNNRLADGSSMGPTHDGRIKPDVVAPGTSIRSTWTDENEIQRISIENGTPTTGTFQLTFNGSTTANINFDADAATIKSRLEALGNIPAGDIATWGGPLPGDRISVRFDNSFAGTNVADMTAAATGLNNGATVQVNVERTGHDNRHGYTFMGGTSMAAPATAGVYALMLEAWQDTYSTPLGTNISDNPPYPSTLRAITIQTARDEVAANVRAATSADIDSDNNQANGNDGLGIPSATAGPDFATGWGNVDALAAVELIHENRLVDGLPIPNRIIQDAVTQSVQKEYDFVMDAAGPLRLTLAWDDKEGAVQSPGTSPTLVNDLDLELVAPDNTIFYPWQLGQSITDINGNALSDAQQIAGTAIIVTPTIPAGNPTNVDEYVQAGDLTGNGTWVATQGKDHLNNVEQVFVQNVPVGQVGHWKARVTGFDVPQAYQDYSLVGFPYPDLAELEVLCDDRVTIQALNTNMTFTWSVENNGAKSTGGSFGYRILLSDDAYLGGDVVLTDTAQQMFNPLPINGSVSHTSTVQISQANADALLGAGTTVNDLLENDVFILIQVDQNNDVLEHKETNLAVAQIARVADVILVFDRSGSMTGKVPVSSGEQTKIDVLKNSANLFLDLMRLDAQDRLAQVSFSGDIGAQSITVDFGPTDQLTDFGAGNIGDMRTAVQNLVADGSTDIRGALQRALDVMTSGTTAGRRKAIIFFSDGKKTSGGNPSEAAFLQQFGANDINVYSVGFGTVGGDAYTGIDINLLQLLANSTANGFFHVTQSSLGLDKFFVNAVAGATNSDMIIDPVQTLAPGEQHVIEIPVNRKDYGTTFIATWDTPSEKLHLSVTSPEGVTINRSNAHLFGGKVTAINKSSYNLLKIGYPLTTGASVEHGGTWKMTISNPSSHPVQYSSSVMSESSIHMSMNLPVPSGGSYWAPGAAIPLQIDLTEEKNSPITTANVVVTANVPLINIGNFLSSAGITQKQLDKIPKEIKGDPLSIEQRMMMAFQREFGDLPPFREDLKPMPLKFSEKPGTFYDRFPKTEIEGYYQFTSVARGIAECDPFRRETVHGFGVGMKIDEKNPEIYITADESKPDRGGVTVTVIPVTVGGSLVGPGHSGSVTISSAGYLKPTSTVTDNLDGSYSQTFLPSRAKMGKIVVTFEDMLLAQIPVSLTIPTADSVTPEIVAAGRDQQITIAVDKGTLDEVSEIVLVSGKTRLPLKLVKADLRSKTITASIPKGTAPGTYTVYLNSAKYRGLSKQSCSVQIIDPEHKIPLWSRTFNERLALLKESKSQSQSTKLIGLLLRDLRDAYVHREIPLNAWKERQKGLLSTLVNKKIDISPLQ